MSTTEEFRIFAEGFSWDTMELPDAFGRLGKVVEAQALKGSTKLLEQAQLISKTYPNIQNLYSDTNDKASMGNSKDGKDHPQGRRPALGRERAQFSFKPLSSRSSQTVDFSSLDHIADPEEYFLAFEQLQIADKELKRLRGEVATDATQHQRPTTARERRPGIPGKRCRFSINTDTIETLRVPKEVGPDRRIASPSNTSSVVESSDNLHPEATEQPGISHATGINSKLFDATESEGSVVLLEKLLSAFRNLDGDDAEALLRKSLHIKSMDVDRTRLTDVDDGVANKLDRPQLPHIPPPIHIGGPPALISTLQRRISMVNPLEDIPMPPIDDDDAPTPVTVYVERSTFKDKIHSPVLEADKTIRNKITSEEELAEPCSHENRTYPNSSRFDNDGYDAFVGFDGLLEEGNDKQSDGLIFAPPDPEVEDLSSGYMNRNDKETLVSSTISSSGSFGLHAILQVEGTVVAEGEPVSGAEVSKDDSGPPRIVLPADGHLESLCILPQENDELQTHGLQEGSGASPNKGQKQGARKKGQNKKNPTSKKQKITSELRTQELPEASGVSPNREQKKRAQKTGQNKQKLNSKGQKSTSRRESPTGVRRSTRIKSRPLEYWRGERFLYGRIYDSLATVIGVKYASPCKDGRALVLKVKSFVPEEYAPLVAQAAS